MPWRRSHRRTPFAGTALRSTRSTPRTTPDGDRLDLLIALGNAQRWADTDAFRQTLLDAASPRRASRRRRCARPRCAREQPRAARAEPEWSTTSASACSSGRSLSSAPTTALNGPGCSRPSQSSCLRAGEWERRLALADEAVACARRIGDEVTLLRVLLHTTEATRLPSTLDQRLIDTEELFADREAIGRSRASRSRRRARGEGEDRGGRLRSGRRGARRARRGRPPRSVCPRFNRPSLLAVLAHVTR